MQYRMVHIESHMEHTKADKGMRQLHIQVHKDMLRKIQALAAEQELSQASMRG